MTSPPTVQREFEDALHTLIRTRASLIYVQTAEEQRLEQILRSAAQTLFPLPVPLFVWSLTEGLREDGQPLVGTESPVAALDAAIGYSQHALFLFCDLGPSLEDPRVVRRLRDAYRHLRSTGKTILLVDPVVELPVGLRKEVSVLDLPVPDAEEMGRIFDEVCAQRSDLTVALGDARGALLRGALGLTRDEAWAAFTKLSLGRSEIGPEIVTALYQEKRALIRKEGILDYIEPSVTLDDIGGLAVLKEWLRQRQQLFSAKAHEYGLDFPKGVLLTGISGCGKSYAAKAVAAYWQLPLVRLDMNRIYAGGAGSPERTLELAIRTAEAVAPCVLWIDEIETAIVGTHGQGGGQATRIFSSLLTWMQEKRHLVFVAATANEIDKLPPEMLRKGRFDEIFFVDLPSETERAEILNVHLAKRKQDPTGLDVTGVAKATDGFTGAELEQLVVSAMYLAFDWNRQVIDNDLYVCLGRTVPLSRTMIERIKTIKRWADTRAVKANEKTSES